MAVIKVIKIPHAYEQELAWVEVDTEYESKSDKPTFQDLLNGYAEIVRAAMLQMFDPSHSMVVDEEGLLKQLPLNVRATYLYNPPALFGAGSPIVGDVYVFANTRSPDVDFSSASDGMMEQLNRFYKELKARGHRFDLDLR